MRVVCISDTHNLHSQIHVPDGDLLIHAGDFTNLGTFQEINKFNQWLGKLKHPKKIVVAGNHDRLLESDPALAESLITNAVYLRDQQEVYGGLKIWGSPHTPWFHNWAFNVQRGEDIQRYWQMIPDDVNILITHGPPAGILDVENGESLGCEELRKRIDELIPNGHLKMHVFGHIHGGVGVEDYNGVLMVNAGQVNRQHQPNHEYFVFDLE